MDQSVEPMEVETTVQEPKSKEFKYKLLERLNEPQISLTKSLTLAITIQTMFSKDTEVLELLFQFFIEKNQLEMSVDLWENELLKKLLDFFGRVFRGECGFHIHFAPLRISW